MHKGRYDFKAIGQAIKEARESRGSTRERLAQEVDLAPRYIMSIEKQRTASKFLFSTKKSSDFDFKTTARIAYLVGYRVHFRGISQQFKIRVDYYEDLGYSETIILMDGSLW